MKSEMYRKNRDDLRALFLGEYPSFFYRGSRGIKGGEIPVFAFHSVLPARFEAQMGYLAANGYRTLDGDSFLDILLGKKPAPEKSVVLTFDDGRGSLWTTAYPILKKHGLHAIAFIVPGRIRNTEDLNPKLDDERAGGPDMAATFRRDPTEPILSWGEVCALQRSGVVDIQSHSSWHNSIFISDHLVDFVNPSFEGVFLKGSFYPVVHHGGSDLVLERLDWGSPIYEWGPGLGSESRYIEDEDLTQALTKQVRESGGIPFFHRHGWRRSLRRLVVDFMRRHRTKAFIQSREERYAEIYRDLVHSKRMIEERIGRPVTHLCYPWYRGCDMAVRASRAAGYAANYWGLFPGRTVNRIGDDPYHIARLIDSYLFLLPGKGRENLCSILAERVRDIEDHRHGTGEGTKVGGTA